MVETREKERAKAKVMIEREGNPQKTSYMQHDYVIGYGGYNEMRSEQKTANIHLHINHSADHSDCGTFHVKRWASK